MAWLNVIQKLRVGSFLVVFVRVLKYRLSSYSYLIEATLQAEGQTEPFLVRYPWELGVQSLHEHL
jgi:hypothetical protein